MARRRLDWVKLNIPSSIRKQNPVEASKNAKLAYQKCIEYIATSVKSMEIKSAWPIDMEKWCRLSCFLEDDLHAEACLMINDAIEKGDRERADEVETWLTIMNASTKLLLLAIDITSHRNAFVVSTKDIEGAWDALSALSSRLPTCGTFLVLDELESEAPDSPGEGGSSDATVDEEFDPTVDVSCSSDDEDDDVSDCGDDSDSDDQGFPGSWSSDPASSDREEDEERDKGDERRKEGETESSSDSPGPELLESEGAHGSGVLAPDTVSRLKAHLTTRGLSSDGTQNDLVDRLLDAVPVIGGGSPAEESTALMSVAAANSERGGREETRSSFGSTEGLSGYASNSGNERLSVENSHPSGAGLAADDRAPAQPLPVGQSRKRGVGSLGRKPLGDNNGGAATLALNVKHQLGGSASGDGAGGPNVSTVENAKRSRYS